MKIAEVRKKVKSLRNLISEFDMLCALIKAMDESENKGLGINYEYYFNVKNRIDKITDKFDELLK